MDEPEVNKSSDEIINELFNSLNVPLSPKQGRKKLVKEEKVEVDVKVDSGNNSDVDNNSDSKSSETEEEVADETVVEKELPVDKLDKVKIKKKKKEKKKKKKHKKKEESGKHKHKKKKKKEEEPPEEEKGEQLTSDILQEVKVQNQALIQKIIIQEEIKKAAQMSDSREKERHRNKSDESRDNQGKSYGGKDSKEDYHEKISKGQKPYSPSKPSKSRSGSHDSKDGSGEYDRSSPRRYKRKSPSGSRSRSRSRKRQRSRSRSPSKRSRSRSQSKVYSRRSDSRSKSKTRLTGTRSRSRSPKRSRSRRRSVTPPKERFDMFEVMRERASKLAELKNQTAQQQLIQPGCSNSPPQNTETEKEGGILEDNGFPLDSIPLPVPTPDPSSIPLPVPPPINEEETKEVKEEAVCEEECSSLDINTIPIPAAAAAATAAVDDLEQQEIQEQDSSKDKDTSKIKQEDGADKGKSKTIIIKSLKDSLVFLQAQEEAQRKAQEKGDDEDIQDFPVDIPIEAGVIEEREETEEIEKAETVREEVEEKEEVEEDMDYNVKADENSVDEILEQPIQASMERRTDVENVEEIKYEEEKKNGDKNEEVNVKVQTREKDVNGSGGMEDGEIASDAETHDASKSKHQSKKAKKDKDKSKEKKKSRNKDKEKSSKKERRRSRSRSRSKSRGKDGGKFRERGKSKERRRSKDRGKSRDRDSKHDKSKDRGRSRGKSSERSKNRGKSRERSRSKDKGRSKSKDRGRSKKSRSVSRSRDSYKSKKKRSRSRDRRRHGSRHSRSRSPFYHRHSQRSRSRSKSKSESKTKTDPMADLRDKTTRKRLLEIARRNAVYLMNNGCLPPSVEQEQLVKIKAGGKSVDELTDFCKQLVATGNYSDVDLSEPSLSSGGEGEEGEDGEKAFSSTSASSARHPFNVRDSKPILMNIRNAPMLPTKTNAERLAGQAKLREQFPVSSGSQHRTKAESEWVPVSPKEKEKKEKEENDEEDDDDKVFQKPSGPAVDISQIVSSRLSAMRKLQDNPNDCEAMKTLNTVQKEMQNWALSKQEPGQFTGTTGAKILSQEELSSGQQAWVRKEQLKEAAPVRPQFGLKMLQKMGWSPGEGLGKNKEGTTEPLLLDVKMDKKGFHAQEEVTPKKHPVPLVKDLSVWLSILKDPRSSTVFGFTIKVANTSGKHPVSALVELCSKRKWSPPDFEMVFDCGPDHQKNFLMKVIVNGQEFKPSVAASTKKMAKANAAAAYLQSLGLFPKGPTPYQ